MFNSQPSLLNTPKVPRRSPRTRALSEPNEFEIFTNRDKVKDSTSHSGMNTPQTVMTSRGLMTEFNITIYVLTQSGAPAVRKCITIDTSLHVSLSYEGRYSTTWVVPPWTKLYRHKVQHGWKFCIVYKGKRRM